MKNTLQASDFVVKNQWIAAYDLHSMQVDILLQQLKEQKRRGDVEALAMEKAEVTGEKKSSLEMLIWQAIQLYPVDALAQFLVDPDERVSFAAARRLQLHGGVLAYEMAKNMLDSKDMKEKILGVFILGQLDNPNFSFRKETVPIFLDLLRKTRSKKLRSEIIVALGHLGDPQALPHILRFLGSKNEETRASVAAALIGFPENKDAIKAMRKLRKDQSQLVKYWAK